MNNRIDFTCVGGATGMVTRIASLQLNGKPIAIDGEPSTPPPLVTPPEPSPGPKLVIFYFDGDRLGADVAAKKPPYAVVADIPKEQANDQAAVEANKLDGSGDQLPAIVYGTDPDSPLGYVRCLTPEHPYFRDAVNGKQATRAHVEAMVDAAPAAQKSIATALSGASPLKEWETAKNTTPPGPMSTLLMLTGAGEKSYRMAEGYRLWYYQTWGQQAPDAGINHEHPSDAEMAFIRSIPKEIVAALAAGEKVDFDYKWHGAPATWV